MWYLHFFFLMYRWIDGWWLEVDSISWISWEVPCLITISIDLWRLHWFGTIVKNFTEKTCYRDLTAKSLNCPPFLNAKCLNCPQFFTVLVIFWLCFWCFFTFHLLLLCTNASSLFIWFLLLCTSVFHLCSSCFSFSAQGFHLCSSCFSQFLSLIPSRLLLSQCRLLCFLNTLFPCICFPRLHRSGHTATRYTRNGF